MQERILMKSKAKDLKKNVTAKRTSLRHALNNNKKIKKNVKQAASELTSINKVLKQGKNVNLSVQTITEAITQNEDEGSTCSMNTNRWPNGLR